ncbi:group II intron reverse transcriptase [Halobacillus hunanensis]|uniref:group II intron reverse transcriptase n=1 Tax=Halobacillus hunanensis TaxID=578214 RepID=UPI001FE9F269|nr:HNH endonuclease [Halobacillus hunanensis]
MDISPEKSQIVNLRKRESEFLGFTIRANKKGKKRVAHTGVISSKRRKIKQEAKKLIRRIKASPSAGNIQRYNSFVLGIHHYFKRATHVSLAFSRLAFDLKPFLVNRLRPVGKLEHPFQPPPFYKKNFSLGTKTINIRGMYLFPIGNVKTFHTMNFSPKLSLYTKKGREQIYKKLRPDIQQEVGYLMKASLQNRSIEYLDNRISRYSMKMGKCEITGEYLHASDVHCHHYVPKSLGGTDKFQNLRILHKDVHRLIHIRDIERIKVYLEKIPQNQRILDKINQYRKVCGMEGIERSSLEE